MARALFKNADAAGTSPSFQSFAGQHTVFVFGALGGSTVKLQISPNNAEWFDIADMSFTGKEAKNLYLGPETWVRGVITGGTPTDVNLLLS